MKKIFLLSFLSIAAGIVSCTSDDDLTSRQQQPVVLNQFCYGPNATDSFNVNQAFNRATTFVAADVYSTEVIVTDDNFTIDMGEIQGNGNLLFFTFTGNANIAIQSGIYNIDTAPNSGNARVSYSLDYDSTMQLNSGVAVVSGLVRVTPNGPGFIIEVDGLDANGVRFHGNYIGRLAAIN